jgi:hypothetical protein
MQKAEAYRMALPVVTSELAKLAIEKLGTLKLADATKLLQTARGVALSGSGPALLPKALVGIGIGVIVGVGVGVFLAPRAGAETRARLSGLFKQATERFRQSSNAGGRIVADEAGVQAAATPFQTKSGNGASAS